MAITPPNQSQAMSSPETSPQRLHRVYQSAERLKRTLDSPEKRRSPAIDAVRDIPANHAPIPFAYSPANILASK